MEHCVTQSLSEDEESGTKKHDTYRTAKSHWLSSRVVFGGLLRIVLVRSCWTPSMQAKWHQKQGASRHWSCRARILLVRRTQGWNCQLLRCCHSCCSAVAGKTNLAQPPLLHHHTSTQHHPTESSGTNLTWSARPRRRPSAIFGQLASTLPSPKWWESFALRRRWGNPKQVLWSRKCRRDRWTWT